MSRRNRYLFAVAAFLAAACCRHPRAAEGAETKELRFAVAAKLDAALKAAEAPVDPAATVAVLQSAAAEALRTTTNVFVEDLLRDAQQARSDDPRRPERSGSWATTVRSSPTARS